MNLLSSSRIAFEPLRSLGFAFISGVYAGVGTSFANPVRMLMLTNSTDQDMIVSFNAVDDHTVVIANSGIIFDFASNKNSMGGNLEQPAGTRVYVKGAIADPTLGDFYVTVIYASQV
jgi:hypothetical protein